MVKKETKPQKGKSESQEQEQPLHQWQFDFLIEQFNKESDRAAVILVASILDETLETLLKSFFVPIPNAQDSLFDSATSPLSNFSSKIDMAFRVGLISGKFARDIHIVRKIRNSFAHDIYGCNFNNGKVRSRVRELENSVSTEWIESKANIERDDDLLEGTRGIFLFITGAMIWTLNDLIKELKELEEGEIEWMYNYEKENN